MLEKNVVLLKKGSDGSAEKVKVDNHADNINLSASIVESNLASYGVPASIVNTMDVAVQVVRKRGSSTPSSPRINIIIISMSLVGISINSCVSSYRALCHTGSWRWQPDWKLCAMRASSAARAKV